MCCKIMKKNKLLLSLLSFFIIGCSSASLSDTIDPNLNNVSTIQSDSTTPKAKWTVMVFISGDNDLEEYVVKDIETELAPLGSTEKVQVVALADRTPGYDKSRGDWTDTKLFHVTKGMKATSENAVEDWKEKNYGDPKTLIDFVSWTKAKYPAEHYALYMWGHGWNWHPGYILEDKTNKDTLDPHELKAILPKLGFMDMVAYDGCNMASIEVEALWKGHASAIVHSQEFVSWDGIEYDIVLDKLNQNPNMTAEQLAIVTNKSAGGNKEKTGSAVVLDARWDKLQSAVDEWAIALKNGLPTNRKGYEKAFKTAQHFIDTPDEQDLYDMANKISQNVNDPIIKEKSKAVMSAVKGALLDEWHIKEYPNANGITISKVPQKDPNSKYYRTSDFAKNTNWDEFLDVYKN